MKFYLNGTQIYAETNTTLTEKVGTFSDGTMPLQISNVKNAILPMSSLTIENGNDKWHFVVVSDSVEVVRKGDKLYKHNLVVRTKEYKLTKHLLRNNNFSQPKENEQKALMNCSCYYQFDDITSNVEFDYAETTANNSHKDINLNSRIKITDIVLNIWSILRCCPTKTQQGSEISFDCNNSPVKNAHTTAYVDIKRYDNGTLVNTLTVNVGSQIRIVLNKSEQIFQNLTDDTVIKIVPNSTKNKFTIPSGSYVGAMATMHYSLSVFGYYYSMLDIVQQIKKQADKFYNGKNNYNVFEITTDTDKIATLSKIIAPEISFTGTTIYQALYQLFSYIDAIPTMDSDGKLTFDYLNNNNQNAVSINKADEKITLTDEYFTNKLVANYQRGKQENAVVYPAPRKRARVTTKNFGVPNNSDYILRVSKPIDYVDKVIIYLPNSRAVITFESSYYDQTYIFRYDIYEIEITDRVLESSVYYTLNTTTNSYDYYWTTNNCVTFAHGNNYIDLLGNTSLTAAQEELYFYMLTDALRFDNGVAENDEIETDPAPMYANYFRVPKKYEIQYYIEYHAIFDGRVEQVSTTSKYEGETYVNQESSSVSLNRMGNNLQGLIAKLGNETENITLGVSSYGSRMKAGSLWVDDDGNRYIANTVRTTFSSSSDKVIVEAEFTKTFNLISQYTKVDQEKRFYEISESLTSKGYDNITEYIYFSYEAPTTYDYDAISINYLTLKAIVERTLKQDSPTNYQTCDFATFRAYTHESDQNPFSNDFIYLPLHIYGSGNSICFETDYNETLNAGNRLTQTEIVASVPKFYTKTTLYTEGLGFADKVEIKGWHSGSSESYVGDEFPKMTYATTIQTNDSCFGIEYKYFKKPNEIFHLNYALAFMGDNFFFGNKFIEQNGIMSNNQYGNALKFYKSNGVYSIIDNTILDDSTEVSITNTDYTYYNTGTSRYYLKITITLANNISCKSWCLADENGNVYIASNKEIANNNEIVIYIIPRRNRI